MGVTLFREAMPPSTRPSDSARTRLSPEERRQQLLRVTSDIIATDGVDNVRIPYVAAAAGVTRPVVYKFFPNRHELIKGVLEDFREDYSRRVPDVEAPDQDLDISTTARAFIDAACDTIEDRGSGGWQLLRSVGPDQEISTISKEFRKQLVQPWLAPLRVLTGVSEAEASALADVMISGAGEILQRWIDGEFSRQQVATLLERIILAVLIEFTE
ncbi:MAG: TetR/AcrR family transcriptional regulator [Deltaproteobacteria bacterium]|nr:TetR/AcrR family transcriptional regulator [Deltaproteobacteria bacterium]MBW2379526.1 TetR/AcrR family transcriptional regulator [Deltaproteobacteria bacterium]